MKIKYTVATAIFYLFVLGLIVFKQAYIAGNVINMIFSFSSVLVIVSLVKMAYLGGHSSSD